MVLFSSPSDPSLVSLFRGRLERRLALVKRPFAQRAEWPTQVAAPALADCLMAPCLLFPSSEAERRCVLAQVHAALRPNGLFLGAAPVGESLRELKTCLIEAEWALRGGASLRLPPWPQAEALARSLTACGFSLPVVDVEAFTLVYDSVFDLVRALPFRAESSCEGRLLRKVQALYQARWPAPQGGGIVATFQMAFLHGWKEGGELPSGAPCSVL